MKIKGILSILFIAITALAQASQMRFTDSTPQTISFQWSDSCLTSQGGCDISQVTMWNTTGINPTPTSFANYALQLTVDETNPVTLLVSNPIQANLLYIGGGSESSITLNVNAPVTVQTQFSLEYVMMQVNSSVVTFGMLVTASSEISLVGTAKFATNTANLIKDSLLVESLPPTITLDEASSLKMSDNSAVETSYLFVAGSIALYSQAEITATQLDISNSFIISPTSSIQVDQSNLVNITDPNNGGTFTIQGTFMVTQLLSLSNSNIAIANLQVNKLVVDVDSKLYIQNGKLDIQSLVMYGGLYVINSVMSYVATTTQSFNSNSYISVQGLSNVTLGNVIIDDNLRTEKDSNGKVNVTLTISNYVSIHSSNTLYALINVQPGATLVLPKSIEINECVTNQGTVQIHNMVACLQQPFYNTGSNSLVQMYDSTKVYAYQFQNNGSIVVSDDATLNGNLISYGGITIGDDQSFKVVGYVDLFESSSLNIQGITVNTTSAAFEVQNIVKMNGDFSFSISKPPIPATGIYVYHLIRSQLYFEGNFTDIIADPQLKEYNLPLIFAQDHNQEIDEIYVKYNGGGAPEAGSSGEKAEKKEKERKLSIAFGILIPLLAICVISALIYVYIKRRNTKVYNLYQKINDDNE